MPQIRRSVEKMMTIVAAEIVSDTRITRKREGEKYELREVLTYFPWRKAQIMCPGNDVEYGI